MATSNVVYLGDGLYASFDGFSIRLYTSDGIRDTNEVFLEPEVLVRFESFVASLRASAAKAVVEAVVEPEKPDAGCSCGWSGPAELANEHPCPFEDVAF